MYLLTQIVLFEISWDPGSGVTLYRIQKLNETPWLSRCLIGIIYGSHYTTEGIKRPPLSLSFLRVLLFDFFYFSGDIFLVIFLYIILVLCLYTFWIHVCTNCSEYCIILCTIIIFEDWSCTCAVTHLVWSLQWCNDFHIEFQPNIDLTKVSLV